jgi:hypothetical protein
MMEVEVEEPNFGGSSWIRTLEGQKPKSRRATNARAEARGNEVWSENAQGNSMSITGWAKCLLQKDLDSVDFDGDLGKKIVDSGAQKVIQGYIPPIALVEDMDYDQAIGVIQYEETANLSNIQPQARFFYELNCSERMMRRLSTYVRGSNGKEGFSDKPSNWEYVPPEGSGARLLKILCR